MHLLRVCSGRCLCSGMYLIDQAGRRKLLLGSLLGVILALAGLVGVFRVSEMHAPPVVPLPAAAEQQECAAIAASMADGAATCVMCLQHGCNFCSAQDAATQSAGYCVSADGADCDAIDASHPITYDEGCPTQYSSAMLLMLMAYLLCFAAGLGPVPWAVGSEIFALHIRGAASGLAGTANWVTNGVVSQTFLLLTHAARPSGAFAVYAAIAVGSAAWTLRFLPETRGLSLAEVQQLFVRRVGVRATQSGPGSLPEQELLCDDQPGDSSAMRQEGMAGQLGSDRALHLPEA